MRDVQKILDVGSEEYWKRIGGALEASHFLRSLHIHLVGGARPHELSAVLTGLCRKERLTELTMDTGCGLRGMHVLILWWLSVLTPRYKVMHTTHITTGTVYMYT